MLGIEVPRSSLKFIAIASPVANNTGYSGGYNVPLDTNPFDSWATVLDCGDIPVTSYVWLQHPTISRYILMNLVKTDTTTPTPSTKSKKATTAYSQESPEPMPPRRDPPSSARPYPESSPSAATTQSPSHY